MALAGDIDELRVDAQLVALRADTAFEDGPDAQLATDGGHVFPGPLILHHRRAGDDRQAANPRELRNQLLGHAISKIGMIRLSTEVEEGQYGDTRLIPWHNLTLFCHMPEPPSPQEAEDQHCQNPHHVRTLQQAW